MPQLSELIRAAQVGDGPAMELLIAQFNTVVRQECFKIGLSDHADLSHSDLMQEVLMQVWKKIHQFHEIDDTEEHTAKAFELWLRKSARSSLSDMIRNRQALKRRPSGGLECFCDVTQDYGQQVPQANSPSSIFSKVEQADRVREALQRCLDEQSRQIVLCHIVDGQTFQQIADSMSLTYNQVRYAFQCSQAKLAQHLSLPTRPTQD